MSLPALQPSIVRELIKTANLNLGIIQFNFNTTQTLVSQFIILLMSRLALL